ncbi:unnamed protein product [Paramecium octaurelia]|uniref:Uncharacterized protein n=1 Tax=Paramecium octaurelia TaxID=43137 RepID=A0A8S1VLK5_PAROT|nr:unnamed protein product [Paramecium octaurelia]
MNLQLLQLKSVKKVCSNIHPSEFVINFSPNEYECSFHDKQNILQFSMHPGQSNQQLIMLIFNDIKPPALLKPFLIQRVLLLCLIRVVVIVHTNAPGQTELEDEVSDY